MCTNYALRMQQLDAEQEYGVHFEEPLLRELFPYRPTKAGSPAKPYNLAPIITQIDDTRAAVIARWGLLPHWAKTDQEKIQPHNAAVEGIEDKPFFREPIRKRRCLVPASGFFDFNKQKERFRFAPAGLEFFAFAGLFNVWHDLTTFTFVTAAPTEWFAKYHHRQPVTLTQEQYHDWLSPSTSLESLLGMLKPHEQMEAVPAPKSAA